MIKNIFICWFQGFNNAPEIVQQCLRSWIYYNSTTWNIIKLDNSNLGEYINMDEFADPQISKNHLSDIIRIMILNRYGGVWVDATTFCNRALDEWLDPYTRSGFFAFERPNNEILIASWFMYSEPGNYITSEWEKITLEAFKKNNQPVYLIIHYLFNHLYNNDQKFRKLFDTMPKAPSNLSNNGVGPHFIQTVGIFNNITDGLISYIQAKMTPLFKLTHKCDFQNEYNDKTIVHYLFSTIAQLIDNQ